MKNHYQAILNAIDLDKKLLAVLIDPEKIDLINLPAFLKRVNTSIATHIFVGGSTDKNNRTETIVKTIKQLTTLPVILFPGDYRQVTDKADALLFLSLISGRNPEYLIEQHVKVAPFLRTIGLEVIPTGYILVNGGNKTTVQKISNTQPIAQNNIDLICRTALAGEYSGKKLIYLEAGSGASVPVNTTIIKSVKKTVSIPIIVGGGIRTEQQLENAYKAGADLVVIGTALEKDESFFNELKK